MPNRIMKESINESRDLTSCSIFAQDLYKRLITYADDYGRFNADPQIMVARLYPRELAVISLDDVIDGLVELVGVDKIGFYTSQPRHEVYGAFPKWAEHQRIRDSKKKAPEPTDTTVNDWYHRRFIPLEMKVAIIERDNFKCTICGKHIAEIADAKKLVKMGTGLFHFDHIIPCCQGGRATMENLRLTCPKCNQERKKIFTYDEILQFSENCGDLQKVAASCGELRPESNPIQSESNPNPNSMCATSAHTRTRFVPPSVEDVRAYCTEQGYRIDPERFVAYYESNGWKVGRNPMRDWRAACRTWARGDTTGAKPNAPTPTALQFDQRDYTGVDLSSFNVDLEKYRGGT